MIMKNEFNMNETIKDTKYVELTYSVVDQKSGEVLVAVEFPIGYVHGVNDILAPAVTKELEGKSAGDVIEVPIDCNQIYGPRDESLVFTDRLENVPLEFGTQLKRRLKPVVPSIKGLISPKRSRCHFTNMFQTSCY